jgi:hypothetical protein
MNAMKWKPYMDGSVWEFVRGQDFEQTVERFRLCAYRAGAWHRLKLRTLIQRSEDREALIVQFDLKGRNG